MSFHCIVWYCMVLYCIRFFCTASHCHVPLLQCAGELPRSASSHLISYQKHYSHCQSAFLRRCHMYFSDIFICVSLISGPKFGSGGVNWAKTCYLHSIPTIASYHLLPACFWWLPFNWALTIGAVWDWWYKWDVAGEGADVRIVLPIPVEKVLTSEVPTSSGQSHWL